jgi:AraC-like DNA-binding protein
VGGARQLLLRQPALTFEAIAAQVGFSSGPHLATAFRRQTGYSPTAFRRLHWRQSRQASAALWSCTNYARITAAFSVVTISSL